MLLIKNFLFLPKFHISKISYSYIENNRIFDKFCNTLTLNYKNRGNKNTHPAIPSVSLN